MKAGDAIAEILKREGIDTLIGYPVNHVIEHAAMADIRTIVVLDERGKSLASAEFADRIANWRDEGKQSVGFVMGGPDGVDQSLRDDASLVLSFSPMTWPHQIARILLAEQLYRATTILAGHPYHRGD